MGTTIIEQRVRATLATDLKVGDYIGNQQGYLVGTVIGVHVLSDMVLISLRRGRSTQTGQVQHTSVKPTDHVITL